MAKLLKSGELIKVSDWEGKILERRVLSVRGNLVFVCTDQEFSDAMKEGREPTAVGWPIESAGL